MTPSNFARGNSQPEYPLRSINPGLFEVVNIPEKGRGLVARCNIRSGTRILCEEPLFLVSNMDPERLNKVVAFKLKTLAKEQQRQFLSLHNNFPGRLAFAGIVKTNALPCEPGATTGGIYAEICLINHSCLANCHNSWNDETQRETIHSIRDILAGEELSISYDRGEPSQARQARLRDAFGFDCTCELCSSPAAVLQASDERRKRINQLDDEIGDPMTMMTNPLVSLRACRTLRDMVVEEYRSSVTALIPRVYYDAFQITVAHSDQARAKVFAERAYKARIDCEGADSPATKRIGRFMRNPTSHPTFGSYSKMWRTASKPEENDSAAVEKWLYRE